MLQKGALFLAGVLTGAGVLWLIGPPGKAPNRETGAPSPTPKQERLARENRRLSDELAAARKETQSERGKVQFLKAFIPQPHAAPKGADSSGAPLTQAEIENIKAEWGKAVKNSDSSGIYELVRKLCAVGEEGFSIFEGLFAEEDLLPALVSEDRPVIGLAPLVMILADSGFFEWAVGHPDRIHKDIWASSCFVLFARSPDRLLDLIASNDIPKDPDVVKCSVDMLKLFDDPRADRLLIRIARQYTDPARRMSVAYTLSRRNTPETRQYLEELTAADPDERVRSLAGDLLRELRPAATGYLVTHATMEWGTGLDKGDILTHLDGRLIETPDDLLDAALGIAEGVRKDGRPFQYRITKTLRDSIGLKRVVR